MHRRLLFGLTLFAALVAILLIPWLALREAKRQAYDATAELTLSYARDILHRADGTTKQAQDAIARLENAGNSSCSPPELALMRQLDLTSSYIQAVGRVRDGILICSSLGAVAIHLGKNSFVTPTGATVYPYVPIGEPGKSPLMAFGRNGYAALVHRDLPLDTWAGLSEMSLGIFQLDRSLDSKPELAQGEVKRSWLLHLGSAGEVVFSDSTHLVAVARSSQFRLAAVAAVPISYLNARTNTIAWRLVPAGAIAGLALAAVILLAAQRQRSLGAALRYALKHREFFLDYQPIVELKTGKCVGAEALLRWRRSTGELLAPDLFIPIAEQTGIISALTKRVLELIEADAGVFLAAHPGFHIALNLSAADLQSSAIVDLLDQFLANTKTAPSSLVIEITERSFLDLESACRIISDLRRRGFEIAIDDFGTGYSSLSHLQSLELDFLKIDRSFVEAIATTAPTSQVVGHIIAMARSLGLRMIAEGVERPAQAEFLAAEGVQSVQGWLFGKPMSFNEVIAKYRGTPAYADATVRATQA